MQRVLIHVMGYDFDLEEALHDVFVQALSSIHNVKNGDRLRSWMVTVAVHVARGLIRKRKRREWLHFLRPADLPEMEAPSVDEDDRLALMCAYQLLEKLGAESRIAFVLRYIEEMPLADVAEACGVSLATIKRRLSRARRQFYVLAKKEPELARWVN